MGQNKGQERNAQVEKDTRAGMVKHRDRYGETLGQVAQGSCECPTV